MRARGRAAGASLVLGEVAALELVLSLCSSGVGSNSGSFVRVPSAFSCDGEDPIAAKIMTMVNKDR